MLHFFETEFPFIAPSEKPKMVSASAQDVGDSDDEWCVMMEGECMSEAECDAGVEREADSSATHPRQVAPDGREVAEESARPLDQLAAFPAAAGSDGIAGSVQQEAAGGAGSTQPGAVGGADSTHKGEEHQRELLLVYEYVENGTVADHLFAEKAKPGSLTWPIRLRIAIETNGGSIPQNFESFKVRLIDFGLSRLFPTDVTHVSTASQGTPGYVDPEYHQCYQLVEVRFAALRIQTCAFDELVDPQLGFASDFNVKRTTTLVAELTFQCLQHDKEFRPSMDEILDSLNRIESSDYDALQAEEMANDLGKW
uniref:Protein kinase domain-containing protein n=1 Tax=Chenopodium quinoa TaxID=63459 RepID=A0A803MU97_CHEQI